MSSKINSNLVNQSEIVRFVLKEYSNQILNSANTVSDTQIPTP
jgi:hypothetical protein